MKYLFILLLLAGSIKANAQFTVLNPGVPVHVIEDIKTDTDGHVVFATDNGVLTFQSGTWRHFDLTNGLTYSNAKAIGIYNGGFFFSTVNRRIGNCNYITASDRIFGAPDSNSFDYISAININNTGDTLYGTDSGQVFLVNSAVSGLLSFGPLGYVTDIGQLHNTSGSVDYHVIATTDKAAIYQVSSSIAVIISTATAPIPSNDIISHTIQKAITYDGTDRGLYIADFTNYPSVPSSVVNSSNSPIPCDTITAVAVKDSMIFLGTPKGLSIFVHDHWYTYDSTNSNLPATAIARLAVDSNSLWIGTNRGFICRFGFAQMTSGLTTEVPQLSSFFVYPNPANDYTTVNTQSPGTFKLSLYDMNNKKILEKIFNGHTILSTGQYTKGMYFYQITDEGGQQLSAGELFIKH